MERAYKKADVGVLVGRFQVAELHPGHVELLDWICTHHPKVVVVLGVPQVPNTRDNPLDYQARSMMLYQFAQERGYQISIVPILDNRSDSFWSDNLDALVKAMLAPGQTAVIYGSRDSFIGHYNGDLYTQDLYGSQEHWSGTTSREETRKKVRATPDFRAGVIWSATNRYPQVFPTVDACIRRDDKWLLVRRSNEDKLRFVGGFADPNSPSYEADVVREVKEETGLVCTSEPIYVGSIVVDDWRYPRGDKIKTMLFQVGASEGEPKVQDDLRKGEFRWCAPSEVFGSPEMLVPEHRPLLTLLDRKKAE